MSATRRPKKLLHVPARHALGIGKPEFDQLTRQLVGSVLVVARGLVDHVGGGAVELRALPRGESRPLVAQARK